MKYRCDKCNYSTDIKSNFNRHLNSDSHIQLKLVKPIVNHVNPTVNYPVNPAINFTKTKCSVCGGEFSCKQSLWKHKKYHCKPTQSKQNDLAQENEKLKRQLQEYQQTLKYKEIEIENKYLTKQLDKLNSEVSELKSFIKSGKYGNTTNYNISIKKYVQQHYSDAPALEGIQDYAKLTYDEDDFIDTLVQQFNNNVLHKYLGNFIIQYYKKDNPAEQSIWNSDVSRLTYIVKELLENNQSIWNHDYKGVKTKNYVINPLLKYIKKSIGKYWMDHIDSFKTLEVRDLVNLQENLVILQKIKKEINNGFLANEIVKYIAPDFYMNKITP